MKIISKSEKDTIKIAKQFASRLSGGEVVLLYGNLGAGKTVFVKAMAKALGVVEVVKSPTFNLMKIYSTKTQKHKNTKTLCHVDAYRLNNLEELLDIGAEEYLGKENVVSVIEWAERITKTQQHKNTKAQILGKIIKIKIDYGKKDNERIIEIK